MVGAAGGVADGPGSPEAQPATGYPADSIVRTTVARSVTDSSNETVTVFPSMSTAASATPFTGWRAVSMALLQWPQETSGTLKLSLVMPEGYPRSVLTQLPEMARGRARNPTPDEPRAHRYRIR